MSIFLAEMADYFLTEQNKFNEISSKWILIT